ncbi:MAG: hypothetical protein II180_14435, partial [Proteobacteria bacterium]|nr:hypothetical protein [Pseudomonadota bacterium]
CSRLFRYIEKNHSWQKKLMVAICAERGMGKTSFLSNLYELLSLSPNDIVTIAPAQSKTKRPFASIRNLIAQRLYIIGTDPDGVKSQLSGALHSMIGSRATADRTFDKLWELWQVSKQSKQTEGINIEKYVEAIQALFASDLKHNRVAFLFDDVLQFDPESLDLLARVYQELMDGPITVIVTYSPDEKLPEQIELCHPEKHVLQSLSDDDLTWFTRKILEQMSQSREKLIIPPDLCRSVAQYACGSPKRALDMMLEKFSPDQMMQWPEHLESIHQDESHAQLREVLKRRLMNLPSRERALLGIASILKAPFTPHTMEAVAFDASMPDTSDCSEVLRHLQRLGFLAISSEPILANSTTYTFKHEFERAILESFVNQDVRTRVYGNAAQWYALNNPDGRFNETIGDLWHAQKKDLEASHYYERVAYSSLSRSQFVRARAVFKKFLDTLPSDNVARRIQVALDASNVTLRLGSADESIRLSRSAWRHALKLSAFSMAAAAALQIADVLLLMGVDRHVLQYVRQAREMLNISMIPAFMFKSYITEARVYLQRLKFKRVRTLCNRAAQFAQQHELPAATTITLRQTEADLTALCGNPDQAIQAYQTIIAEADLTHNNSVKAETYRSLGNLYFRLGEKSLALDSWNKSLGLVQEMNDVFMHAGLLCDISEGAIALQAFRTARATSEQSLSLSQKLGQKLYIARCLANNAEIHFKQGQIIKAERALRKALAIAQKIRNRQLILRILTITANCCGSINKAAIDADKHDKKSGKLYFSPAKAEKLFTRISSFYESCGMELDLALIQPCLANYYIATKQNIQALNAYRKALSIYEKCGVQKNCFIIENNIRALIRDTNLIPGHSDV